MSIAVSRPSSDSTPRTSIQSSPIITLAPMRISASANPTSPWMLARPTPSTRTGPPPIAPAARKYDADDASPSTMIVPGDRYCAPGGMVKRAQPSRSTRTPKRSIRRIVISM